jgi:hypothetical protein
MNSTIWLVLALGSGIALASIWMIWRKFKGTKSGFPTDKHELTTIGITLTALGIVFGEDQLISYTFIVAGILLSLYDAIRSSLKRRGWKKGPVSLR